MKNLLKKLVKIMIENAKEGLVLMGNSYYFR